MFYCSIYIYIYVIEVDFNNFEYILIFLRLKSEEFVKYMYNGFLIDFGKIQFVYRVILDLDEIYCLGFFIQVLLAVFQDIFVIAVEIFNKEEVLRIIYSKGQNKFNLY